MTDTRQDSKGFIHAECGCQHNRLQSILCPKHNAADDMLAALDRIMGEALPEPHTISAEAYEQAERAVQNARRS